MGDAARLPKLGIHADLGKARHRVHFVDVELACLALQKEIYPRQAAQVERKKRLDRHAPQLLGRLVRDLGGKIEAWRALEVPCAVEVEIFAGPDLSDGTCKLPEGAAHAALPPPALATRRSDRPAVVFP